MNIMNEGFQMSKKKFFLNDLLKHFVFLIETTECHSYSQIK